MDTTTSFPARERFTYFLNQVQVILDKADGFENPGLLIYQQNIRTPFFMLEALTRLYKKISDKKIFAKLNASFKEIEDSLGAVDYYDGFYKDLSTKKNVPESVTTYLNDQKEAMVAKLNVCLEDNNWIGKNQKRIRKIFKNLDKVSWLPEKQDVIEVKKIYGNFISSLTEKFKNNEILFTSIENDVHEFRRELRWLSIYPQAFRGLFQLKASTEMPEVLKKYLTPEIISSPYNIMPDGAALPDHIFLDAANFYAISWVINELGKIKDNGLRIIIIEEALTKLLNIKPQPAEELAYSICGETQMHIPELLDSAKNITTPFFQENVLDNLVC
ncbi:MAG: hypothetical protein H0W12_11775 [Chitinophagaceae bacterium]|nr:hypothetical protein [Chitinophagaceae bacterium]